MEKKSNFSFRRFDALSTADSEIETEVFSHINNVVKREQLNPTEDVPKPIRIPEKYVQNITNFSIFCKKLILQTGINNFSCKSKSSIQIIHSNNVLTYNTIIKYFTNTGACYHTFLPHILRRFKAIIQNLYHTTVLDNILDAFAK